ncbi:MAG: TolC family outer membrane protein [Rhodobacteraceae bacterium]|nr:TolC family outer membrane protein [Paracoccaceae bacterium]
MRKTVSKGFFKTCVFAGGLVAVALVPKSAQADNISDAMIGAYKTSGLLEQNRALLRATDENVAIAVAQLRPVISWTISAEQSYNRTNTGLGISQSSNDGLSTGISLQWLLFDGGASQLDQLAAQETVLATRQSLLNIEQQVMFSAVQAYVNVLLQQDTVALRGNNLRLLQEELKAAQDRFEVGEVTRTDVALAQSRVAGAQASLAESRGDLVTAQAVYIEVVGHSSGGLAGQPSLPQRATSVQAAHAIAARNHPSLLAQQHAVKAADLSAKSTAKSLGPSVSFSATAAYSDGWSGSGGSDNSSTSITLSQPIYAGGALAARSRASVARVDAEKGALISVQRSVAQFVSQAYAVLEASGASLLSSNERVRAAQVAFDGIREEATLGARTTLDVLQSEQELLDAQTARVQARANQVIAAFGLLSSQGLLTAEHMGLAVEIYDPTLYYNLVKDAPTYVSQRSKDLDRVMKALGKN